LRPASACNPSGAPFMATWSSFFSVIGSAAAALLGLLFVVISINAPATLGPGQDHSRRLAEQVFQNYLAALWIALLNLIPDTPLATLGKLTLLITLIWVAWALVRLYQGMTGEGSVQYRLRSLRLHMGSLIGYSMLTLSALHMALSGEDERDWFAFAVIVLMFSATRVSWQFLVRIARANADGS